MAFSTKKESVEERDIAQTRFVNLLKKYKILFNNSQLLTIKAKKNNALTNLQRDYSKAIGKVITVKQLKKKMQYMKAEIRKKIESTEDIKVALNKWERNFYQLMVTSNAIKIKLPVKECDDDAETPLNSFKENDTQPRIRRQKVKNNISFTSETINDFETEETRTLSTNELQRLVLLEQLKLIRIKIAKEEGWVQALAQKSKKTRIM